MTEQRLEQIWRDNLSKYNGNIRLDSIIIRAMHQACKEVENNLTINILKQAFVEGANSRNEEYETQSIEDAWNEFKGKYLKGEL